jgi:hypothetical protein
LDSVYNFQKTKKPCDLPIFTNCSTRTGRPSTWDFKQLVNSSTSLPENSHKKDFLQQILIKLKNLLNYYTQLKNKKKWNTNLPSCRVKVTL